MANYDCILINSSSYKIPFMPLPNFCAQDYRLAYYFEKQTKILCYINLTARGKMCYLLPTYILASCLISYHMHIPENNVGGSYQTPYIVYFSNIHDPVPSMMPLSNVSQSERAQ